MPSTYTNNLGIQKPGTGEQSGSWGDTVNTNSDILDVGINGVLSLSLSGTSSTLTTSDGVVSNGQYKALVLTGTPSGTHTITISPNDAQKIYFVYNTTAQTVIFTQGSGGNVTLLAGDSTIIYANGAGAGSAVVSIADHLAMSSARITGGVITGITDLAIADGGTGASTALDARANLGLIIGTSVQAYDAGLQSISGLTTAANQMIYTTASDTYATTALTAYARTLLDDADAATSRITLGLGTIATQASSSVSITGGTINGAVIGGVTPAAGTFTTLTGSTSVSTPLLSNNGTLDLRAIGANIVTVTTGSIERTRVDASGNYGVGAVPSAWRVIERGIDIGGYGAITGGVGSNLLRLYSNSYVDTSSTFRYKNSSTAALYSQVNGAHSWSLGPTGIAGDPITFTQAMTLHASGGLSLGNTLDPGATNLSVTGGLSLGVALAVAMGGTGSTTASGARTNLGLGTIATQASSAVSITGGSITGITDLAVADGGTGASDAATARANLGAQAALGFTPVEQGGGTSMGTNKIYVGWNGIGLFAQVDTTSLGRLVINADATGASGTYSSTQLFGPGNAPLYATRAWVNFNGTGVVAIRASGNVSSITDNGTGNYTVNFTTAMIDANYAVSGSTIASFGGSSLATISQSTTGVQVTTSYGGGTFDASQVHVVITR